MAAINNHPFFYSLGVLLCKVLPLKYKLCRPS